MIDVYSGNDTLSQLQEKYKGEKDVGTHRRITDQLILRSSDYIRCSDFVDGRWNAVIFYDVEMQKDHFFDHQEESLMQQASSKDRCPSRTKNGPTGRAHVTRVVGTSAISWSSLLCWLFEF
jgi:hypothetical protein